MYIAYQIVLEKSIFRTIYEKSTNFLAASTNVQAVKLAARKSVLFSCQVRKTLFSSTI